MIPAESAGRSDRMKKLLLLIGLAACISLTSCTSLLGNLNHQLPVEEKEPDDARR